MAAGDVGAASVVIEKAVERHLGALVALRRDLHANPELAWHELRTTEVLARHLAETNCTVTTLAPTGLLAEIGERGPMIALRADLDALPVHDTTGLPWASLAPDVAHACGHDVHATALLGAAIALSAVAAEGLLPGRVRMIFQPAEEVMPGGALEAMAQGALAGVQRIYAVHCDPGLDVGRVGLRVGPITGAGDRLEVRLAGAGGHTSRPHLTEDLVFALGKVITELPAIVSRRLDPRAGFSVVWGMARSGSAANVIPDEGMVAGTVRMLDPRAWLDAESLVRAAVAQVVAPYEVVAEVIYTRGVPPVVNHPMAVEDWAAAVTRVAGAAGVAPTNQSLGGEDFGWYLDRVPGGMARLGTRTPGGPTYDLHQGSLRVDEAAVGLGARLLAEVAIGSLVNTGWSDSPL